MKAKKGTTWKREPNWQPSSTPRRRPIPGTKMLFAGAADPDELANLIAYRGTLSDLPQPLPKASLQSLEAEALFAAGTAAAA